MDGRHICLVGLLFHCCRCFFFFFMLSTLGVPFSVDTILSFYRLQIWLQWIRARTLISTIVCACVCGIVYLLRCVRACACEHGCVAYYSNVLCSVHICVAAHQNSVSKFIYWLIRKLLLYQSDMICIEDGPKLVSFVFFSLSPFGYSSCSWYVVLCAQRFSCIVLFGVWYSRAEHSICR